MPKFALRIMGLATGDPSPLDGQFVAHYDPGAFDGRGDLRGTTDPRQALRFDSAGEAMECWRRQAPPPYAVRWDGRPNRPLTAYTAEVVPVEE